MNQEFKIIMKLYRRRCHRLYHHRHCFFQWSRAAASWLLSSCRNEAISLVVQSGVESVQCCAHHCKSSASTAAVTYCTASFTNATTTALLPSNDKLSHKCFQSIQRLRHCLCLPRQQPQFAAYKSRWWWWRRWLCRRQHASFSFNQQRHTIRVNESMSFRLCV